MMQRTFDDIAEQHEQIARVRGAVADAVLEFVVARGIGADFHADELRRFVAAQHPTAPASSDRILRDLRARGILSYVVVDRRASQYQITELSA